MATRPYSIARRAGDWVVTAGQLGLLDGELVAGGFLAELDQALENLHAALTTEGARLRDVVKTTVFLADINDWPALNDPYVAFFERDDGPLPARSAFEVAKLPLGGRVEIEAWAYAPRATT